MASWPSCLAIQLGHIDLFFVPNRPLNLKFKLILIRLSILDGYVNAFYLVLMFSLKSSNINDTLKNAAKCDFTGMLFSSPERKAQGELIVWDSSRRPSVRASICPCVHTFKHKYL